MALYLKMIIKHTSSAFVAGLLFCCLTPTQAQHASLASSTAASNSNLEAIVTRKQQRLSKQFKSAASLKKFGPIIRAFVSQKNKSAATEVLRSPFLKTQQSQRVQVYLKLTDAGGGAITKLQELGVAVEVVNSKLRKVQAWVDIAQLESLSELTNIELISAPLYGRPRTGQVNSQGDAILRANQLRGMGFRGQGIKVGVVSDGSNNRTTSIASGDLPSQVSTFGSCTKDVENLANCQFASTCNEGTAMAEIIHDLAPDAQLAIAAVSTSLEFIQRINQLANTFNADIIVDDLGFFGEPYFEDGDLADAVAALPSSILYISSAGNSGNTHYEDNFKLSAGSNFHDFGTGDEGMGFFVGPNRSVLLVMQWNDPFDSPNTDLDLFVTDNNAPLTTIGTSTADQSIPGTPPLEAVCVFNTSNANIVNNAFVNRFSGTADRRLEMFFLGSPAIEYSRPAGSIFGHSGIPRTLAIGTINANEPGNNSIAFYSSRGPSRIDFPNVQNRKKPDLIGIDGVGVTGAGGFSSPFFGTSAAAPHVAAVAAQLMSVSGKVTAKNVKDALTRGAVDLGSAGFDSTYGFGRVDGVAAKNVLKEGTVLPPFIILFDEEDD